MSEEREKKDNICKYSNYCNYCVHYHDNDNGIDYCDLLES